MTASAFAQTPTSSQLPDYVFSQSILGTSLAYLYPEINLDDNPSAVLSFNQRIIWPFLGYSGSKNVTTLTNLAQSASPGGTSVTTTSKSNPSLYLTGFMPFGKNMVAAAGVNYSSTSSPGSTVNTNYTAAGTSSSTTNPSSFTPTYGVSGTFGIELGNLGIPGVLCLGLATGYANATTQAKNLFTTFTNSATLNGATYYTPGANQLTKSDGTINANGGATYSAGALTAGLGLGFSSETINRSTGLIAVDKNGDGTYQTLVSISTWATSTQSWGGNYAVFAYKNTETKMDLNLYPSVTYKINPMFSVVASGSWRAIGSDDSIFYGHTTSTDKSQQTTSYNSGLGTFTTVGGVKITPISNLELRVGVGYTLSTTKYSNDVLNTAGTTTYSSSNSNHYAETTFPAAGPANGAVKAVAVDPITGAFAPTTSQTGSILAVAGAKWDPMPKLSLFADAALSDPTTTKTYNAFDTNTNKVWTEVQKTGGLNWNIGGVIGLAFRLTNNFTLAASTSALSTLGFKGTTTTGNDGVPSSGGTNSTNLTGTSSVTTGNTFSASISGLLTF